MYIFIVYVLLKKDREKNYMCKKDNKHYEKAYFSIKFCLLHTDQKFGFLFFERNAEGEAPTSEFCFEIIRTQIRVNRDLNLGVVHPCP
jgi:hypothetical protein